MDLGIVHVTPLKGKQTELKEKSHLAGKVKSIAIIRELIRDYQKDREQ